MITASSLTNGTLTVIFDNGAQIITARNDHPKWNEIIAAYNSENNIKLEHLLSLKAVVESYSVGQLSVNGTGVTYAGHPLHTVDSDRVLAFLREGIRYRPIANYIEKKMKNPSARAITEMYNFLEHKNMSLTPSGNFIAYKGVSLDYWSIKGNKDTIVLQGQTNSEGQILNTVGATIEVERRCVDDDFRQHCSTGLHVGSLAYALGWGKRVILVEVDPADVVSVPDDCNCQKLRCCKYKVIGEYTGPLPDSYTEEFSSEKECINCNDPECDGSCEDCEDGECICGGTDCPNCGCECDDCQGKSQIKDSNVSNTDVNIPVTDSSINKDVLNRLRSLLSKHLDLNINIFTNTCNLDAVGMDSLDAVELAMSIETEFQINEIPDEDLDKFQKNGITVSELAQYIQEKLALINEDAYENHYLLGLKSGSYDKEHGLISLYRDGDQNGADSPAQKKYMEGYLEGYGR